MKFAIIKSCLARFSGIFAVGTPSNIHGTAIRYRCAKFGAFVNSVTILTLRDLTIATSHNESTSHLFIRAPVPREVFRSYKENHMNFDKQRNALFTYKNIKRERSENIPDGRVLSSLSFKDLQAVKTNGSEYV